MKSILLASTALIFLVGTASAGDLKTYKATYEKRLDAIIVAHGTQMAELGEKYTKALDALLIRVKAAGDLDKTTAVMDEIVRFGNEKAMPAKQSELLDVQNFQVAFMKEATIHNTEKAKTIIDLAASYDKALDQLQKTLVASDRLDDARKVQDERNRVRKSDEYQVAETFLKSHGVGNSSAGNATHSTITQRDEVYTLTVKARTGTGKYDPSDGDDRVRMYVFLADDDANKKELKCAGFGQGSEITFEGLEFDYPLEKVDRISLLCKGGTDAWGMDSVSFQFIRGNKSSEEYAFKERTSFSGEGSDSASTLKSFKIPSGVRLNRIVWKSKEL